MWKKMLKKNLKLSEFINPIKLFLICNYKEIESLTKIRSNQISYEK